MILIKRASLHLFLCFFFGQASNLFSGINKSSELPRKTFPFFRLFSTEKRACTITSYNFLAPYIDRSDTKRKITENPSDDAWAVTIQFGLFYAKDSNHEKKANTEDKTNTTVNCTHVIYFPINPHKDQSKIKYNMNAERYFSRSGNQEKVILTSLYENLDFCDSKPVTKTLFDGWIFYTNDYSLSKTKDEHFFPDTSKLLIKQLSSYFQVLNNSRGKLMNGDLSALPMEKSFNIDKHTFTIHLNLK